jgi:hypothetical protein
MEGKSTMKALIIYDDFASAVKVIDALQHSAQNLDFSMQWNIRPWRADMLRFTRASETALSDAANAHLIVFAYRIAQSLPFWLEHWLEHWAKCRQIEDAALAVYCDDSAGASSIPAILEMSQFATRHGLNFIFDDKMAMSPSSIEDKPSFIEGRLHEREMCI